MVAIGYDNFGSVFEWSMQTLAGGADDQAFSGWRSRRRLDACAPGHRTMSPGVTCALKLSEPVITRTLRGKIGSGTTPIGLPPPSVGVDSEGLFEVASAARPFGQRYDAAQGHQPSPSPGLSR